MNGQTRCLVRVQRGETVYTSVVYGATAQNFRSGWPEFGDAILLEATDVTDKRYSETTNGWRRWTTEPVRYFFNKYLAREPMAGGAGTDAVVAQFAESGAGGGQANGGNGTGSSDDDGGSR